MDERRSSRTVSFVLLMIMFLIPLAGHSALDAHPWKSRKSRKKKAKIIQFKLQSCQNLINQNKLDEALKCTTLLVIDYPKNAKALNLRGQVYYKKGEFEIAMKDINRAISLTPKDYMLYINRGSVYYKLGDMPTAAKDFSKAIKLKPKYADSYLWRVAAYELMGKYQEALGDIEKYIKFIPKASNGYSTRARLLYALKRFEECLSDCFMAEALNPKNTQAINLKALVYLMRGNFKKALEGFDKAITLNARVSGIYNNRGVCQWLLGKKKEAIEDLKKSLKLSPKAFRTYFHLGYFMHLEKDTKKAKSYFRRSFQLNPQVLLDREKIFGYTSHPEVIQFYKDELTAGRKYIIFPWKDQAAGEAALEIKRIYTKPQKIIAGEKFVIVIQYMVSDPSASNGKLTVNMNFKILEGEKTLFKSDSIPLQSEQGVICSRNQNMNASRRKGSFTLEVTLNYKNERARKTIMINIL